MKVLLIDVSNLTMRCLFSQMPGPEEQEFSIFKLTFMASFMKKNQALLVEFMDRGGKVIVTGAAAKFAPKHKNLTEFPLTASLPEAVRKVCL